MSELDRLYSIYSSIGDSAVENTRSLLTIMNESFWTASNITKSLFHQQSGRSKYSGAMISTDVNRFIEDREAKSRDIIIKELNDYIEYLRGFRSSGYKICALYAYLMFEGLFNILGNLYIPEDLRYYVDRTLEDINNRRIRVLEETIEYFIEKGDEKILNTVRALGNILLSRRADRIRSAIDSPNLTDADVDFIANKHYEFLKLTDSLDSNIVFEGLGISQSSYHKYKSLIIKDLVSRLSEDNLELLKEIFLR